MCVLSLDVLRLLRGSRDGLWRGRDGGDWVWRLRRCAARRIGGSQSRRSRHQSRRLPSTAKYSVSEDRRRVKEVVDDGDDDGGGGGRNGIVFWFRTRGHHV